MCEMGSPDTALPEYGAGEARMESSMDFSRCGGSWIAGHRLRKGNRQRPDRRRGGPRQGDHNPYRDPRSSRTKNAQSAAGKQNGSLESQHRCVATRGIPELAKDALDQPPDGARMKASL